MKIDEIAEEIVNSFSEEKRLEEKYTGWKYPIRP